MFQYHVPELYSSAVSWGVRSQPVHQEGLHNISHTLVLSILDRHLSLVYLCTLESVLDQQFSFILLSKGLEENFIKKVKVYGVWGRYPKLEEGLVNGQETEGDQWCSTGFCPRTSVIFHLRERRR